MSALLKTEYAPALRHIKILLTFARGLRYNFSAINETSRKSVTMNWRDINEQGTPGICRTCGNLC